MRKDNLYHFYAQLIHKELRNQLDPEEKRLLEEWLSQDARNREFFDRLTQSGFIDQQITKFENIDSDASFKSLESKIPTSSSTSAPRHRWIKKAVSVAAVLTLVLLGWSLLHLKGSFGPPNDGLVNNQVADAAPGKEKAMLMLPDGSAIDLERMIEGNKRSLGDVQVTKNKGFAAIRINKKPLIEPEKIAKIIVPVGGKYAVELQDGTKVWLNSASSLSFPTEFRQGKREVTLMGEAYFEVAHDPGSPFIVEANGTAVKVLGTHFNIKAYQNEEATKTTLMEGKVEVRYNGQDKVLEPGYQALSRGELEITKASMKKAIAWKEGYFLFESTRLDEVLRQLERWYDIKVDAHAQIPTRHFNASIEMDTELSKVIEILELSGEIDFEFKNGILYVKEKD